MSLGDVQPEQVSLSRSSFHETLAALGAAQKSVAAGAPPYSILVNRRLGRYAAALTHQAAMTPNQVTGVSAGFTFGAILLLALATPDWWVGAVIWAALAVGYILDSADGQLARLRGVGSLAGEWLDHVVDCTKIVSLHLAVLVAAYRHFQLHPEGWLLVPIGYAIVGTVSFFAMVLNDQLKTTALLKSGRQAIPKRGSVFKSIFLVPTDYGVLCFIFVLLGAPWMFFTVYSLFFAANSIHLTLALVRWFGDMKFLSISQPVSTRSKS
ncbi:CDP-alcohol phosphatidyltransferase family protein [Arthrobacter sp. 2YAF22_2]|uniref:CDP-alcohol phosphatidyltransferase family protein n=1 Tax=Arthrobacter sp. 2YAF22_2 TaxID=3233029 RepID=UPI003F8F7420